MARFLAASLLLALGTGHAALESPAYAAITRGTADRPLDEAPIDILWLASALSLIALEVTALIVATLWSDPSASRAVLAAFGALAAAVGIAIRIRSITALGPGFARPPGDTPPSRLLTAGPFGVVRHPSELGLLLISLGMTAIAPAWPTLALMTFAVVPLMALRIAREERVLRLCFSSIHAAYVAETPLIFPAPSSWRRLLREP